MFIDVFCSQIHHSVERVSKRETKRERERGFLLNPTNKPWNVFHDWRQFNFLLQWIQRELTPAVAGCRMLAGSCAAVDALLLHHEVQCRRRAPSQKLHPQTYPHLGLGLLFFPIKLFPFLRLLSLFFNISGLS